MKIKLILGPLRLFIYKYIYIYIYIHTHKHSRNILLKYKHLCKVHMVVVILYWIYVDFLFLKKS